MGLLYRLAITGMVIGTLGMFFIYFFGDFIISVIYGDKLSGHSDKLLLIMFAAAANNMVLYMVYVLTAIRQFKAQLIVSFFLFAVAFYRLFYGGSR